LHVGGTALARKRAARLARWPTDGRLVRTWEPVACRPVERATIKARQVPATGSRALHLLL